MNNNEINETIETEEKDMSIKGCICTVAELRDNRNGFCKYCNGKEGGIKCNGYVEIKDNFTDHKIIGQSNVCLATNGNAKKCVISEEDIMKLINTPSALIINDVAIMVDNKKGSNSVG